MDEIRTLDDRERVQLALAAGAIIGTWFWDLKTDRFTIDEQFAEAFGIAASRGRAGLSLEQVIQTVHPDDKAGLVFAIETAIARGGPYAHQYRVRRLDGQYYWIEANGRVEKGVDGEPLRFPGVLLDLERRRSIEAERDRAHILARTIMEATPGVVFAKDRQGRMIAANRGTAQLIGKSPAEFLGQTDADFLDDPERAAFIMTNDRRIMETGIGEQIEEEVRLPSGEVAVFLSTKDPLRNEQGEIFGLVGTSIDITARRATEQDRKALNERLQHRIDEAIAQREKAEDALRQAQKMEVIGQLTGGVAHDFNNLLTIIGSSVDLLRRPGLSEDRRERYLNAVADTVQRAAKLTGQLLAFARRQALAPESFPISSKLRNVAELLQSVTGSGVTIDLESDPEEPFVHADMSQFETAIMNLAINARDAIGGNGRIKVRTWCADGLPALRGHPPVSGDFVAVSVTDQGVGIPADSLSSIFEPFYTTKEVGKGTGLGLSQVFGFAKQSGGDIGVVSEPGAGSTFTLYLPRAPASTVAGQDTDHEQTESHEERSILIVEDNVEVGHFANQILEDLGYRTRWVTRAEEALALVEQTPTEFDIVFSDVVMPGMGGIELARRLRMSHPDLQLVLTSGYSHVLAEEGVHDLKLLHKPYTANDLARMLGRVARKDVAKYPSRAPTQGATADQI